MDDKTKELNQKCGERLKIWRTSINLTQEQLAEKIGYKDSKNVSAIECGERSLPPKKAEKIVKETKQRLDNGMVYSVRKEWLYCESDIMTTYDEYLQNTAAFEQWHENNRLNMNKCAYDLILAAIKSAAIKEWEKNCSDKEIIEKLTKKEFPEIPPDDFDLIWHMVIDYVYNLVHSYLYDPFNSSLWGYINAIRFWDKEK